MDEWAYNNNSDFLTRGKSINGSMAPSVASVNVMFSVDVVQPSQLFWATVDNAFPSTV